MRPNLRRTVHLLPILALSMLTGVSAQALPRSLLIIEQPAQPYALGSICQTSSVQIVVRVHNAGPGATGALPGGISVTGGRYTGRATVPAMAPGATTGVSVRLDVTPGMTGHSGAVNLHATLGMPAVGGPPVSADVPAQQSSGVCTRSAVSGVGIPLTPPGSGSRTVHGVSSLAGGLTSVQLLHAPGNAHAAKSLQECGAHGGIGGGFVCQALFPKGVLILVWDYNPNAAVDGFKIYRMDGGKTLVRTQADGASVTLADVPAANGTSYNNACFAVSAYQGSNESALSPSFCSGSGSVAASESFGPANVRSWVQIHSGNTGQLAGMLQAQLFGIVPLGSRTNSQSLNTASVGYYYATSKSDLGDTFYDLSSRAGINFDLSSISGRTVSSATLHLKVSQTMTGPKYSITNPDSCATNVGLGKDYWWTYGGALQNADFGAGVSPGVITGPDISIDVTKIVANWVSGSQNNYGFILRNTNENMNAFTEDSCVTGYFSESLQVTYF